ncbi:aminopeptidase P family protein [Flavilitoribacter nigricans]|uniref:Peptidase M24 n=1 Tax=Flavilitoribacter nigricans (strain ATCC 23147 / DSM 23189 / NBRC 102662 / NCIMB 1420 / SS-2) TaxID=1122177 RepID=A0A2D0N1B6_FLAN2|nr:aminopeptidase P family protein [Flavilitoribacter nigricans]PHN02314.1 peptidase M24 [Flavilitoribacter nigricans DSM 23189 = NBRC 102662]
MPTTISERLAALRAELDKNNLDAYIIPSSDPHQSEYVAPHWKSRKWISGFTGSAGLVIVTRDHAGLWTDSRYFLQASTELADTGIELHKQLVPHAPEHVPWLAQHLPRGSTVGLDGFLFSQAQVRLLEKHCRPKGIDIRTDVDLISPIWEDRPPLPRQPIFAHDVQFAGRSRTEKLNDVRLGMQRQGATAHLIPTLDDIAWTLNIRGSDVNFNPIAYAYLLVGRQNATLFIEEEKVPATLRQSLQEDGVSIRPYDEVIEELEHYPTDQKILVDSGSTSIRLIQAIQPGQLLNGALVPRTLKAIKNETEIGHIRRAMVKDGVALTRLFRWLESQLQSSNTPSEAELAEKLAECRSQQDDYVGESFPAIVGYQANGAIIHYRPWPGSCADIRPEGILLLDSGGQYLDGTTDITRTVALGEPTAEQKKHFTLVLKGYIALDRMQFPTGTAGGQLDAFARQYLWQHGLNYGHGTGHGVGFFLNVHEPPQGFATSVVTSRGSTNIEPGMLTSNEPGFYKNGHYGIRIENLILCVEREKTEYGDFLGFEALTLFPIDTQLIRKDLLSAEEVDWLNAYHRQVEAALVPHLDEAEQQWMREKCAGI